MPPCPSRRSELLLKTTVRGSFAVRVQGCLHHWKAAFWHILSASDLDFNEAALGPSPSL